MVTVVDHPSKPKHKTLIEEAFGTRYNLPTVRRIVGFLKDVIVPTGMFPSQADGMELVPSAGVRGPYETDDPAMNGNAISFSPVFFEDRSEFPSYSY